MDRKFEFKNKEEEEEESSGGVIGLKQQVIRRRRGHGQKKKTKGPENDANVRLDVKNYEYLPPSIE